VIALKNSAFSQDLRKLAFVNPLPV